MFYSQHSQKIDKLLPVVLDTNILVSALWSKDGNAAKIIRKIANEEVFPYYTEQIWLEYEEVLFRPKLNFDKNMVNILLQRLSYRGLKIQVKSSTVRLPDESDRKFYDIAKSCKAVLITGNIKHFPEEPFIFTPQKFLQKYG